MFKSAMEWNLLQSWMNLTIAANILSHEGRPAIKTQTGQDRFMKSEWECVPLIKTISALLS